MTLSPRGPSDDNIQRIEKSMYISIMILKVEFQSKKDNFILIKDPRLVKTYNWRWDCSFLRVYLNHCI